MRERVLVAIRLATACLVSISLMSGCTVARYYKDSPLRGDASSLVEGQSTKSDVLRLFGPPVLITHQTDGDTFVYAYERENYSSFHVQDPITGINWFTYTRQLDNHDRLVVLFDFAGVVRGIAVDRHTEDMPVL
jgi:outer membrane protein assembly factor BamE (lipoprotein component of BamABCDE complex)